MGFKAQQTPEKQVLPIAPIAPDPQSMLKWSQDLTRTLAQNLATIARKANDDTTLNPTADINFGNHSITGVNNFTMSGTFTASGLSASQAVQTNASKQLITIANTGTGNNVLAAAPTISGVAVFSGKPSLTGGALTFPATQVPSAGGNDLDDYSEQPYTPTVTATAGTFTTVSAVGAYTKVGRVMYLTATITMTTIGTASGGLQISLPLTAGGSGLTWGFSGRETALTGKQQQGIVTSGGTTLNTIRNYDNTSVIANGNVVAISGFYWV